MIESVFRTDELPAADRYDSWVEMINRSLLPAAITSDHTHDFRAAARALDLHVLQLSALRFPSLRSRRTRKLIRQDDPETCQLALNPCGTMGISQLGRQMILRPGGLMAFDSSHTFDSHIVADNGTGAGVTLLQVPRTLLPLPATDLREIMVRPLSGRTGIGMLITQLLGRILADTSQFRSADGPRLGAVLLELLSALLANELDDREPAHRPALLTQAKAFIHQHLGDAGLSPGMVAAAHHISTRHLHRLFNDTGMTVAGWIRRRRLEQCHRDLVDPRRRAYPIQVIAARWGFTNPAHFSRVFRAAYGMSPSEHRHDSQRPR
ncbi:helix-turn-helix domain-containing protein [Nonomuraea sp. NN258]|uniref:helix-turn-helix domain-containing protein n=1 Tax=Nonomuraea antri TaxID=2730852 RepID=UPI0015680F86|nr:helix-turn-helix domain-containing protein [Nonomuraea antri]NRQ37677.1 helix-turn-helix domain-containing protein [Nonomuraea antri]